MQIEKRYQVFVSSTYADLQDERQEVMQALLELDCIPAGMELFPAANEDQWSLIKRVIDDCDYYIVIIAGRYGSLGPDGLSYTEMEYRYALERSKPVIGFVHKTPGSLAADRCEASEDGKRKLDAFRGYVQKKMCRFWESPADLGSQVSRSLVKLIKTTPAVGWVRGDLVPELPAAEEILRLRTRIEELEAGLRAARTQAPEGTASLAQGEDEVDVAFTFDASANEFSLTKTSFCHKITTTWDDLFAAVSPLMIHETSDRDFRLQVSGFLRDQAIDDLRKMEKLASLKNFTNFKVTDTDFQTIKVQLRALGLITMSTKPRSIKDSEAYWTLTPYGDTVMTRLRAIGRDDDSHNEPAS